MRRKLLFQMFLTGLLGILLATASVFLLYYHVFSVQVRGDAVKLAQVYAAAYEQAPERFSAFCEAESNMRLTLVSPEGIVLADSEAQGILENHAQRPEIRQALETGAGSDERISSTLSVRTFYEAVLLSDGNVLRVGMDTASIYAVFMGTLPWLLAVLCILSLLAFLLSQQQTRLLVQPIIAMGEHLDQVEENVPYPELQPLATALAQDRDLRRSQEQFRREFTANVSHELKTPLTSISGYAELMANGMVHQEDVAGFASQIHQEAVRMISLVTDIIKLSELEGHTLPGEPALEFVKIDLCPLSARTVQALLLNARRNHVTLSQSGETAFVQGSATLLQELCENLVENALRYNRPGGQVTVSTGVTEGKPFLRVQDTGIGIPLEAQSRVFERFYRVDKSRSKATGGTGLGLAIVKHIALLHHAELLLESELDVGTTITVVFPPAP